MRCIRRIAVVVVVDIYSKNGSFGIIDLTRSAKLVKKSMGLH
jgi:hypothetical protein